LNLQLKNAKNKVMDLQEFKNLLAADNLPKGFSLPLQALWHEAKGDWHQAHHLAQAAEDTAGAWVHAYLHRKGGDASNAVYWYSRAGQAASQQPFEIEWEEIAQALLQRHS
jgi:hypothetical protein